MLLQEKLDTTPETLQGRSRAGHGVESLSRRQKRSSAVVTAAAAALEQHDELLAPAAQRHAVVDSATGDVIRGPRVERAEWRDPTDLDPHRRHARTVSGFRRVDVLRNLHARGGLVTPQHLVVAERLTADYEIGIAGASLRDPSQPAIRSTAGGPGDAQLAAATRYREAVEAVGPSAYAVLTPVVLDNWTVRELAARRGVGQQVALGLLIAALDRLVEWYDCLAAPRPQKAA